MTQLQERTSERVVDRRVREPPVRKAPPPKVPHPPRVGLPIRWIGWMAAVIVLGAVAAATWLAVSPGGEEVATWDLFTQEREAAAVPLPDEATPLVLGLTMPGGMGIEPPATQSGLTMPGGMGIEPPATQSGLTMPGGMGIEAPATQSGLTMPGGLGTGE